MNLQCIFEMWMCVLCGFLVIIGLGLGVEPRHTGEQSGVGETKRLFYGSDCGELKSLLWPVSKSLVTSNSPLGVWMGAMNSCFLAVRANCLTMS